MSRIEVNRNVTLLEIKFILSEHYTNYNFEIKKNYLYIVIPSQCTLFIRIKDNIIKIDRVGDFGDFLLFFLIIFGWIAIALRGNTFIKNIGNFLNDRINNQITVGKEEKNIKNSKALSSCPVCKSPNEKKILECEWCGSEIPLEEVSKISSSGSTKEVNNSYNSNISYQIILKDSEKRNHLALVKEIKEITGLGLAEAKKIAETPNSIVLVTENLVLANYIKSRLEELDSFVQIKEC